MAIDKPAPRLSDASIIEIGKRIGREIDGLDEEQCIDPEIQGRLALQASIDLIEVTDPELQKSERILPEGIDGPT